jgi:hypothetical protein
VDVIAAASFMVLVRQSRLQGLSPLDRGSRTAARGSGSVVRGGGDVGPKPRDAGRREEARGLGGDEGVSLGGGARVHLSARLRLSAAALTCLGDRDAIRVGRTQPADPRPVP